jgi:hypothetical protein
MQLMCNYVYYSCFQLFQFPNVITVVGDKKVNYTNYNYERRTFTEINFTEI